MSSSLWHPGYLFFAVTFFNLVQSVLDLFLDCAFGYRTKTGTRQQRAEAGRNYERSAQIVDIRFRGAISSCYAHKPSNFLLTHKAYCHPKHVLENDNVSLMGTDDRHVWFSVIRDEVDIFDMIKNPFLLMLHWEDSHQLVLMPHWAFHRLAEEMEDPVADKEVIGIAMTARSGSTLLTQMFHRLPATLAFCEPWFLVHANEAYNRHGIPREDYKRIVVNSMKLQLKPVKRVKYDRVVIKLSEMSSPQLPMIMEAVPHMKLVLSVRHPKPCLNSWGQFFQGEPMRLFPTLQQPWLWKHLINFDYDSEDLMSYKKELASRWTSKEEDYACMYASAIDLYLKHRHMYKFCVMYEDLVKDPEGTTEALFRTLDLDVSQVPLALTAMKRHSQNNVFGDPTRFKYLDVSEKGWRETDAVLARVVGQGEVRHDMTMEQFKKVLKME